MRKAISLFLSVVFSGFLFLGCDDIPVKDDLSDNNFQVVDQDSVRHSFPKDFTGKITLVSYIYTHCPDVCPIIITNMKKIQQRLGKTARVQFVGISFDPERDTPQVLSNYSKNYALNTSNWDLLTGDKIIINSLMERLGVQAHRSYTSFTSEGSPSYFMNHTDRITLMDTKGRIRRHYSGSQVQTTEVVSDIRTLQSKVKQQTNK